MLRWKLTLGLLATLIILLLISVYGVWLSKSLGKTIDHVLQDNYDSIRVCHYMRTATARVNTFYSRGDRPAPPYDQPETLEEVARAFDAKFPVLERNAKSDQERKLVADLKAACQQYIQIYRDTFRFFAEGGIKDPRIHEVHGQLPNVTLAITELSQKILERNERQMFKANEKAERQTRDSIRLLVTAVISAILVFLFTYFRLGHSIIAPINNLTKSIRELRSKDFEQSLPVEAEDELGALTREFNGMALELRNFYRETDRKLIELNQIIRAMLTTLPYPLFILGEHDEISRMNPAAEKLMASLGSRERLPVQIQKHLAQASITGPDYRLDDLKQALLFRIDDQEIYFLPRIFSIVLEDGTVSGRALMLVDVTRFRWLDEMKSDMLATLSHEIRTPLTGIRLVLHLLLENSAGELTATQHELVSSACNDCERLLKTLASILDLARMESGTSQLNLHEAAARTVLEENYLAFRDRAEAASRPLRVEYEEPLPKVMLDPERLSLVFANLLTNAVKYGYADTEIVLRARPIDSAYVRFSVMNSGPGISHQEQTRVFDKFYRSSGHKGNGVGLGLSIARQIVLAHSGRIGLLSEPGKLTEFYFDLPAAS